MEKKTKLRIFTSVLLLIVLVAVFISKFFLVYILLISSVISTMEFTSATKKIKFKISSARHLSNLLFILYIFSFSILFYIFSVISNVKLTLFFAIIICVFSDIGGFIVGKKFNGPKLTSISPNKTVYGSLGSLIFSLLAAFIFFIIEPGVDLELLIIFAITVSIGCQLGDILFSLFKRKAKIKDYGKILPGHGGILDRIDGLLIGVPFGVIVLIIYVNLI